MTNCRGISTTAVIALSDNDVSYDQPIPTLAHNWLTVVGFRSKEGYEKKLA